ncbi:MAG: trigger factor [Proteobacteria bacterium]|nr:trigger factor [Pseudomonadota bacterium]
MQVVEVKNDGLIREYTITLLAGEIDERVNSRLSEIRKTAQLPGFRPGKVPTSLLKQRYGQSVMGEVLERAVGESSRKAIEDNTLRPAMQPNIEIKKFGVGEDLEYSMSVQVMPEIVPMDFSKIEVERLVAIIPDSAVDETLERLAKQYRSSEPIKRARKSREGDEVVIDFKGSVDGVEFPGGSGEGHHLELGAGQFIPGFEDQLIGVKAGDSVSVSVTFPAEYGSKELAGKDAVFAVDVKEIRVMVDTAIDDEFAKTLGQESLDDLKKAARDRLSLDYAGYSREKLKRDLLDTLEKSHSFELPPGMVDAEFDSIWNQFEEARKNGQTDATEEKSDDELKEDYRKIAARRVMLGLLLADIGNINKIEVTAEEINRALVQQAQQYPGHEQQFIKLYQENPEAMASLRAPIFEEKVVDFILEMAKVSEREVSIEELIQSQDDEDAASDEAAAKPKRKKRASAKDNAEEDAGDEKKE